MSGTRRIRTTGIAMALAIASAHGALAAPIPPVVVKNTTADPVPVRIVPADEPFQQTFWLDFADGSGMTTSSYTVPADKRLVIEYASMTTYLPAGGQSIWLWVATTAGNGYGTSQLSHALDVQKKQDYGLLTVFGAAHLVKIYALPGTEVRVTMGRYPSNGLGSGAVILSGRLESLP